MRHAVHLALFGLASLLAAAPAAAADWEISAEEAIERSIANPDEPIDPAWVEMNVCGTGSDGGRGFLNSMENFRDRRSLNAMIPRITRRMYVNQYGEDPIEAFYGKRVQVFGMAQQVRINLYRDGVETGHYYQTQLPVLLPEFMRVVYEDGEPVPADCDAPIE